MHIFNTNKELNTYIANLKQTGKTIGFVPTMGALHEGHLSLIRQSKQNTDITVSSIFVNPTQFNNKNDLDKYPRTLERDIDMLKSEHCDIVFIPTEDEIYPTKDTRVFDLGNLDKVMEGRFRPGHFNGVAQVVSRLFDIVQPDKAFFGEKDFQQVAVIRRLVKMLNYNIEIIGAPIMREPDGLAMSSRNMRLNDIQRKNVSLISNTLFKAVDLSKTSTVQETKDFVIRTINENEFLDVEYFEIVDSLSLEPINSWNESTTKVGCIAVHVGEVRLIDNITF